MKMWRLRLSNRWLEAFEGENNRISMMRLMVFLSFWPASYIALSIRNTESLAVYLGAYVGGAIGGKTADVLGRKRNNVIPISRSNKKS